VNHRWHGIGRWCPMLVLGLSGCRDGCPEPLGKPTAAMYVVESSPDLALENAIVAVTGDEIVVAYEVEGVQVQVTYTVGERLD